MVYGHVYDTWSLTTILNFYLLLVPTWTVLLTVSHRVILRPIGSQLLNAFTTQTRWPEWYPDTLSSFTWDGVPDSEVTMCCRFIWLLTFLLLQLLQDHKAWCQLSTLNAIPMVEPESASAAFSSYLRIFAYPLYPSPHSSAKDKLTSFAVKWDKNQNKIQWPSLAFRKNAMKEKGLCNLTRRDL